MNQQQSSRDSGISMVWDPPSISIIAAHYRAAVIILRLSSPWCGALSLSTSWKHMNQQQSSS
ncbi:hypothetical protein DPMN_144256 [Dreissena polymorpha]|uniref:Uncharacterized protein n=1 Tax=Dreissena polymorpha TaxID=45954 RepID=A0A9D4GEP1_DREPO|nr:hypothetical protein DPMN_144256 [Dreissena polymorpha]